MNRIPGHRTTINRINGHLLLLSSEADNGPMEKAPAGRLFKQQPKSRAETNFKRLHTTSTSDSQAPGELAQGDLRIFHAVSSAALTSIHVHPHRDHTEQKRSAMTNMKYTHTHTELRCEVRLNSFKGSNNCACDMTEFVQRFKDQLNSCSVPPTPPELNLTRPSSI